MMDTHSNKNNYNGNLKAKAMTMLSAISVGDEDVVQTQRIFYNFYLIKLNYEFTSYNDRI